MAGDASGGGGGTSGGPPFYRPANQDHAHDAPEGHRHDHTHADPTQTQDEEGAPPHDFVLLPMAAPRRGTHHRAQQAGPQRAGPRTRPELRAAGDFEPADQPTGAPGEHKLRAPRWARVYVFTCSDSRTEETDDSGRWIRARLADLGHVLCGWAIVPDEPVRIVAELERARAANAQVALITGGTGLTSRDATFEAVSTQLARPIPGFGELFRVLSFQEIGPAAMLSRAVAGVRADGLLVFAMPGSPAAVRLACEQLIFPELTHLLEELAR
jgi:molybdenum cofactor biosynthesis protein B